MPPKLKRAIAAFDEIANDPQFYLDMEFEEGDIQLISNHVVRALRSGRCRRALYSCVAHVCTRHCHGLYLCLRAPRMPALLQILHAIVSYVVLVNYVLGCCVAGRSFPHRLR